MNLPERHFSVDPEEYPFTSNWFKYEDSWLHYVDTGEGVPVILLHDNPVWSFCYRNVIKSLDTECRLIAPDYPGFGFSHHPPQYSYMPQDHAKRVQALIDHLQLESYVLAMHMWGAPIGLSIAVERPQDVAGLVIGNAWAWPLLETSGRIFSLIAGGFFGRYMITHRNWFIKKFLPMVIQNPDALKPEILAAYDAPSTTPESRIGQAIFPKALTSTDDWMTGIEAKLNRLSDKPTEFVVGMRDTSQTDEKWKRWRKHFPHANKDMVEEAGLFVVDDAPERFADAIRRVLATL